MDGGLAGRKPVAREGRSVSREGKAEGQQEGKGGSQ